MLKYYNFSSLYKGLLLWTRLWFSDRGGVLIGFFIFYLCIYFIWFISSRIHNTFDLVIADILYLPPPLIAFGFILRLVVSHKVKRRVRFAWFILALALMMFVIGDAYSIIIELNTGAAPAFPSIADVFFICFYPIAMASLLIFPLQKQDTIERLAFWIDISMVMLVMLLLFWHLNIEALLAAEYESWFSIIATLGYPIGDLFLLFGLAVIILRDPPPLIRNSLLILALAFFLLCLTDITYVYQLTIGIYEAANYLDLFWSAFYFLIALSAQYQTWSLQHPEHSLNPIFRGSFRMLPYGIVILGYALVIKVLSEQWLQPIVPTLIGAILLSMLVIIRQIIMLRENDKLRTELENKNTQLLALSMTDSLTGISNRRAFDVRLTEEIARTHRYHEALTLIMIDVDRFKPYNDSYGHLAGDVALQMLAQLLRQCARPIDMVARYGGEEFAMLLPNTDLANGIIAAERLRHVVANHDWPHRAITASFGVASVAGPTAHAETLHAQADTALYKAKVKRNDVQALYEV